MSGFVMVPGWLIEKQPSGAALLAYVNLAKRGTWNPGTGTYEECRPSMARLAKDMKSGLNTARRGVQELEVLGAVLGTTRYDEDGSQLPTVYRVVFGVLHEPRPPLPNQIGGGSQIRQGGTPKSDRPPLPNQVDNQEPLNQEPFNKKELSATRGKRAPARQKPDLTSFDEWYSAYPRKSGKADAIKAYAKALEQTDAATLLAGAEQYRNDPGRDPQFTKLPATWLNKGCWEDEPLPVPSSRGPELIDFNGVQVTQRSADALEAIQRVREQDDIGALFADWDARPPQRQLEGAPW